MQLCLFQLWTKTSGAMELCYSLQVEESAFHVALSSHPLSHRNNTMWVKLVPLPLSSLSGSVPTHSHVPPHYLYPASILFSTPVSITKVLGELDKRLIIIVASLQGSAPPPHEYDKVLQVPPHLQMVFPWRLTSHRLQAAIEFLK